MIAAHSSPVASVTPPRAITPSTSTPIDNQQSNNDQSSKRVFVYNGNCTTFTGTKEINFAWTIHDFNAWISSAENVRYSSQFPANYDEMKWNMRFLRESLVDKSFSSLYLELKKCPDQHVNVTVALSMRDANQIVFCHSNCSYRLITGKTIVYQNFIKRDVLIQRTKPDNTLIINVKISVKDRFVDQLTEDITVEPVSLGSSLTQDIASLLESKKFGDVWIKIGNRKLLAHKAILSSRSTVFAAMFDHTMKEKITNVVTITDIETNVFDELLRYVYTDKVNNLPALSHQLYAAADKYDLQGLKSLCRTAIMGNLTAENVSETLICAHLQNDAELKSRALQLMSSDRNVTLEVIKSSGWRQLLGAHSQLVTAVVEALANKI